MISHPSMWVRVKCQKIIFYKLKNWSIHYNTHLSNVSIFFFTSADRRVGFADFGSFSWWETFSFNQSSALLHSITTCRTSNHEYYLARRTMKTKEKSLMTYRDKHAFSFSATSMWSNFGSFDFAASLKLLTQ